MTGIVLLGLGPGGPDQMTREAWELLVTSPEVWLRNLKHPAIVSLPTSVDIHSLEELCEDDASSDAVNDAIVQKVLELGKRLGGVIYAVPGHPLIAETTGLDIFRRAMREGVPVRIVGGPSFLESTYSALGLNPLPRSILCDALSFGRAHTPLFPPDTPALIAQLHSKAVATRVKVVLAAVYPGDHTVSLVHAAGTAGQRVENLALDKIDQSEHIGDLTCLFIPALEQGTSIEGLLEVVAHLRAPEGCPWDREQTHASLRRNLLEEAYESIEAMDSGAPQAMREEFGDLLLQIVLNAQIASEHGEFTINDVIKGIHDKIIRRHPHVFGDLKLQSVESVLVNWEKLKEGEREFKSDLGGLLEGVPLALPSLSQAQEYQERAARVGFDWPHFDGVLEKVAEEIREMEAATSADALAREIGDVLFTLVNLSRWKGVDAEAALRAANLRFKRRFAFMEQEARRRNQRLSDLTLDEMEALWRQAKASDG